MNENSVSDFCRITRVFDDSMRSLKFAKNSSILIWRASAGSAAALVSVCVHVFFSFVLFILKLYRNSQRQSIYWFQKLIWILFCWQFLSNLLVFWTLNWFEENQMRKTVGGNVNEKTPCFCCVALGSLGWIYCIFIDIDFNQVSITEIPVYNVTKNRQVCKNRATYDNVLNLILMEKNELKQKRL